MKTRLYLGDEDTGDALRVVPFRVGGSQQLLAFALLKAVEEGGIQDVLQHLKDKTNTKTYFLLSQFHSFTSN